jgi:dTDP-4-dehydrorhamnose reductase
MIKKRVLILGSTGMLGHMLYYYLESLNKYDIYDISFRMKLREESIVLDVRKNDELEKVISFIKPNFVINCIGVLIKGSSVEPWNAILLNSCLPHFLSAISTLYDFRLIHISTDCVFSGVKGNYSENDFRDADDIYGRSKALGELINNKDLTFRTSIIGPEIKKNGEGLFHWFLTQKVEVNGYTNVFWTGLTTLELAKIIEMSINNFKPGLYNLAPSEKITKYDLIKTISESFGHEIEIKSYETKSSDKSLVCSSLFFEYSIGNYVDMINELKDFMFEKRLSEHKQYFRNNA